MDLALNSLQRLICDKIQTANQPTLYEICSNRIKTEPELKKGEKPSLKKGCPEYDIKLHLIVRVCEECGVIP